MLPLDHARAFAGLVVDVRLGALSVPFTIILVVVSVLLANVRFASAFAEFAVSAVNMRVVATFVIDWNPGPVGPVEPVEPVLPVGPVEPVEPVEPVVPVVPVGPVGPVEPVIRGSK